MSGYEHEVIDQSNSDFLSSAYKIVTPGETIGPQDGYLRGHGTYTENSETLVASVCGVVERVNKLVKVDPLQSRYRGDVGDLVVGRIEEVGEKSWKVDVGSSKSAVLMLSSVCSCLEIASPSLCFTRASASPVHLV